MSLPDYLAVPAADLGRGTTVTVVVKKDMAAIGQAMAADMLEEIQRAQRGGKKRDIDCSCWARWTDSQFWRRNCAGAKSPCAM